MLSARGSLDGRSHAGEAGADYNDVAFLCLGHGVGVAGGSLFGHGRHTRKGGHTDGTGGTNQEIAARNIAHSFHLLLACGRTAPLSEPKMSCTRYFLRPSLVMSSE